MRAVVGEEVFYRANGMASLMLTCNIRILMLYASESSQLLMFGRELVFCKWGSQVCPAGISRAAQVGTWTNAAMNQGQCV